jgi:hypothetical protein
MLKLRERLNTLQTSEKDERNPTRVVGPFLGKTKSRCGIFRCQPAWDGVSR